MLLSSLQTSMDQRSRSLIPLNVHYYLLIRLTHTAHLLQVYFVIRIFINSECVSKCLLSSYPRPASNLVASFQVLSWWFTSVPAGVVRMLRVDNRKVNQHQSSDPPALFRTSKACCSLFSQYVLTAISAVSAGKALYMCTQEREEFQFSGIENAHRHACVFDGMNSPKQHFRTVWLTTSWLRLCFEEVGPGGPHCLLMLEVTKQKCPVHWKANIPVVPHIRLCSLASSYCGFWSTGRLVNIKHSQRKKEWSECVCVVG